MAGVLSFTLGLEASNFLRQLNIASGGIISLAAVGQGLQSAMQGVWGAIEKGAALKDLSARTNESVDNLFKLQHAFNLVGAGADAVAPALMKFQKTMSGVTEDGEKTEGIIRAIGLSFDQLKTMSGPERIAAVADALNKINADQAAGIAGKLFGREGASSILQVARSMNDFTGALKDAAPAAQVFARSADAFDAIDDTITTIKMKVGGMFAGIAEGVQPALQRVLDLVNGFDFVGFGQMLGHEIELVFNSISMGRFAEYFATAIMAGLQEGFNFLATADWVRVADNIKDALVGESSLEKFAERSVRNTLAGMTDGKSPAESMNPYWDQLQKIRSELMGNTTDTNLVPFVNWVTNLHNLLPKATVDLPGKDGKKEKFSFNPPNVTDIEKIGFMFNNGISRSDYQRDIATNTRRTYEAIQTLAGRVGQSNNNSFSNQ